MSSLAAIFNVPSTRSEFDAWGFAHAAHHRDINRKIFELGGGSLIEFVLDPINPDDTGAWLYQHQAMHAQMDAALGIEGYDLLEANFKDPNELSGWIWLHAQEHYQAAGLLGIG